MTLTPEILDELERLEKAATAGPWCAHPNGTSLWQGDEWTGNQLGTRQRHICNATGTSEQHVIDLELLCEVRNHLPALIAAARELAQLKASQNTCIVCQDCVLPLPPWTRCENCSEEEAEDVFHHGYEGSEAEQRDARGERPMTPKLYPTLYPSDLEAQELMRFADT